MEQSNSRTAPAFTGSVSNRQNESARLPPSHITLQPAESRVTRTLQLPGRNCSSPTRPIINSPPRSNRARHPSFTTCPMPPSRPCPPCRRRLPIARAGHLRHGAVHALRPGSGHGRLFRASSSRPSSNSLKPHRSSPRPSRKPAQAGAISRRGIRRSRTSATLPAPAVRRPRPLLLPAQFLRLRASNPSPRLRKLRRKTPHRTGLTDEELEQRNLPPLRGPWIRIQRQGGPLSPRDEAEQQLQAIESSYSGWLGGSTVLNYRTGDLGYGQLAAIEAPFEASAPLGYHARVTVVATARLS